MARLSRSRSRRQTQSGSTGGGTASLTKRQIYIIPPWDPYLVSAQQATFESKVHSLIGYKGTPQWEVYKTWNIELYDYSNIFGQNTTVGNQQFDSDGATLYLPFAVPAPNGDARPSRDLKAEAYRAWYTEDCRVTLADGAEGIFVDDVNMDWQKMFGRWNGSSYDLPLITNWDTGDFYTSAITGQVGWAALIADFLTDIRARVLTGSDGGVTYPNAKFYFNTQWNILRPLRWTDPRTVRMLDASDVILCAEHGFADPGVTGGGFPGSDTGSSWSLRDMLKYVDQIHARGKRFATFIRRDGVRADQRRYDMALYLAKRSNAGGDIIGMGNDHDIWPTVDPTLMLDPGQRLTYNDDGTTITATFEDGSISVVPGDRASAVINIGPVAASLDQFAFRVRLTDTSALNGEFGTPVTPSPSLDQFAFRVRPTDASTLNAAFV